MSRKGARIFAAIVVVGFSLTVVFSLAGSGTFGLGRSRPLSNNALAAALEDRDQAAHVECVTSHYRTPNGKRFNRLCYEAYEEHYDPWLLAGLVPDSGIGPFRTIVYVMVWGSRYHVVETAAYGKS